MKKWLQKLKKQSVPEPKRYSLVPSKEDELAFAIKITEGKFSGLVFRTGKIGFAEGETSEGEMRMVFDYFIESNEKELDIDQECVNVMGDILYDIMEDEMKSKGNIGLRSAEDFKEDKIEQ